MEYDDFGNTKYKRDVGHYCYDVNNGYALTGTSDSDCYASGSPDGYAYTYDDWCNLRTGRGRTIVYSDFDEAISITKAGKTTTFDYDTSRSRYQRITDLEDGSQERTLYFGATERFYERASIEDSWNFKETRRNLPGAIQTLIKRVGVTLSEIGLVTSRKPVLWYRFFCV